MLLQVGRTSISARHNSEWSKFLSRWPWEYGSHPFDVELGPKRRNLREPFENGLEEYSTVPFPLLELVVNEGLVKWIALRPGPYLAECGLQYGYDRVVSECVPDGVRGFLGPD
jgi:hypothetical protein